MDISDILDELEPLVGGHFTYAMPVGNIMNMLSDSNGRMFTIAFHPDSVTIWHICHIGSAHESGATNSEIVNLHPDDTAEQFAGRIYNKITTINTDI